MNYNYEWRIAELDVRGNVKGDIDYREELRLTEDEKALLQKGYLSVSLQMNGDDSDYCYESTANNETLEFTGNFNVPQRYKRELADEFK